VQVCHGIFGIGVTPFSKGKDGGRDARFEGRAEKFPSAALPWDGKVIIQAKSTSNPLASCSDRDFINLVNKEELPKIKKLKERGEVDCYIIFTNRKLTAQAEESIRKSVKQETGVDKFCIVGVELLNSYLSEFPEIPGRLGLNKFSDPIVFYENDIVEIINIISEDFKSITNDINIDDEEFKYLDKEQKNIKNNLSKEYFDLMKQESLAYFSKITLFLTDPKNKSFLEKYKDFISEINNKIVIRKDEFDKFEKIFEYIFNYITLKNKKSLNSKRFVWVFLHFMYFNCDLGQK